MAHAAGDAHEFVIYGAHYRVSFPILDADGDLVTGAAALDSEASQDGGTFADVTNEATELATSSGMYYLDLIGTETDCKQLAVIVKTTTSGAKTTPITLYPNRLPILESGVAEAGAATTITFAVASASAKDDFYNGCYVFISDNDAAGSQYQVRKIVDYVGSTRVATIDSAWGTNPSSSSNYDVLVPPGMAVVQWAGGKIADPTTAGVPEVDLTHISGDAQSVADLKDFADAGYDPATNKVQGVVLVDTLTTYTGNTPQTGDSFARLGLPAGASVSADIAAIEAQTDDIGVAGAGLTAVPWNAAWDAEVESEATDALNAYDPPTRAEATADKDEILAAINIVSGTADSGSTTTMVDAARTEGDNDYWKGAFIRFTSGTISGQTRIITDFVALTDTFTFAPPTTQAVGTNTYVIISGISVWDDTLAEHLIAGSTGATINSVLEDTGTTLDGRIPAALVDGRMDSSVGAMAANTLTASALAADAVDEIWAKTMTELAAVPGVTASVLAALSWVFEMSRNKITQTATTQLLRNDADSATIGTSTLSDDGTTFTRGEFA